MAYADLTPGRAGTAPFAVIGDTHRTMVWEYFLFRESNPLERQLLFEQLALHRPEFLVIAGDLTCAGSSRRQWHYFDRLTAELRDLHLPILPIPGNHDYWYSSTRALGAFAARFPQLAASRWYTRKYGSLALVLLDANARVLSKDSWRRQEEWYAETLAACDADAAITGVLVFAHQPPFTNSRVTSDDKAVQRAFVPAFVGARKTLALISGHTHAYEHFFVQGKHFIVTGGGGGPRVKLRVGSRQLHADLYAGPAPRPFHFLWITPGAAGIDVAVKGLDKGETALRVIDRFAIRHAA